MRSGKGKANSAWWLLGKVFVRKDPCVMGTERVVVLLGMGRASWGVVTTVHIDLGICALSYSE